jgi:hypothetical protein
MGKSRRPDSESLRCDDELSGLHQGGCKVSPKNEFELLNSTQGSPYGREGLGGSLINLILGGVILWVGQTTFQHNGQLSGMVQQLEAVNDRYTALRDRHDALIATLNDRTKARFTEQDGEKLEHQIQGVALNVQAIKEHTQERIGTLRLALASVDMSVQNLRDQTLEAGVMNPRRGGPQNARADRIPQLRYEVDQLRSIISANSASNARFRQTGHSATAFPAAASGYHHHNAANTSHVTPPEWQEHATAYAR